MTRIIAPWAACFAVALSAFAADEPAGPLTLEDAAAFALERNPALRLFPWDLRIAEARALQASLRPNPEVGIEVENIQLSDTADSRTQMFAVSNNGVFFERERTRSESSGFDEAEITLRLSQLFVLGGKLRKGEAAAMGDRALAHWDYQIARRDVLRDTAQAFIAVLAAQERVEAQSTIAESADELERVIAARVDGGKAPPVELRSVQVQTSQEQLDRTRAQRELRQARAALAATWGSATPEFDRATGDLYAASSPPPLAALLDQAESSPDLQRWTHENARREAILRFEKSRRVPDLTASLGFVTQGVEGERTAGFGLGPGELSLSRGRTEFDDDSEHRLEFELSIPLPIFNRNQGSIREAELLIGKAADERSVTFANISAQLAHWHEEAQIALDEIHSLESSTLPAAESAHDLTRIGYDEGKLGYIEVLTAQQTLFGLRVRRVDAYGNLHHASIEIARLIGDSIVPTSETLETESSSDRGIEP